MSWFVGTMLIALLSVISSTANFSSAHQKKLLRCEQQPCECSSEEYESCACLERCQPEPGECLFGDAYDCMHLDMALCESSRAKVRCPHRCQLCKCYDKDGFCDRFSPSQCELEYLRENCSRTCQLCSQEDSSAGSWDAEDFDPEPARYHSPCIDPMNRRCCDMDVLCPEYDPRNCMMPLYSWNGFYMRNYCCSTCYHRYM